MNNSYIRAQQCKVKEAKFHFVKIGGQYWTTKNLSLAVTPQGNTIPEIQANGNIEKVVNGGFDTDTNWVKGTGWSIGSGTANINGVNTSNSDLYQTEKFTIGKYYKISLNVVSISTGNLSIYAGSTYPITAGVGLKTLYIKPTINTLVVFGVAGTVGSIDNVSVQEIGWAGSQELYDGIYAQTEGTVEQKTYAAVKAAAMWCNYDNDAPTGVIYGKLYNWFAVKLFQMDIDYYNAANPTKKWGGGWRIPTQSEFQTLSTYLGGGAVSGGHLKEAGTVHWNSPNTGADNSSGFTALGCGRRNEAGVFDNTHIVGYFWNLSNLDSNNSFVNYLSSGDSALNATTTTNIKGFSICLIKA